MGERGKVRKTHAGVPREASQERVPQRPSGSLQDHEQSGSDAGQQDHTEGGSNGEEAQGRSGEEVQGQEVTKQYGEQWRGIFNGTTYRLFAVAPSGFMPELLRLQRMYSHPPEDESWEDLWVVA